MLYNLHRAKEAIRKEDRALLVEGYMDAIGVSAAGFREWWPVAAPHSPRQQVQMLKRHSQRIVVNFDPDAAGANAAERSIALLLDEGMHVRILELDGDLDPDEYCKERGADAYRERLEAAKDYFSWLADRARDKHDVRTAEGMIAVLQVPAAGRATHLRPASSGWPSPNDVASYIGVDRGMALEEFPQGGQRPRRRRRIARRSNPCAPTRKLLLRLLLADPEAADALIARLRSIAPSAKSHAAHFQAVFAHHEAGERIGFDAVIHGRRRTTSSLLARSAARRNGRRGFAMEAGGRCLRQPARGGPDSHAAPR